MGRFCSHLAMKKITQQINQSISRDRWPIYILKEIRSKYEGQKNRSNYPPPCNETFSNMSFGLQFQHLLLLVFVLVFELELDPPLTPLHPHFSG